MTETNPKNPEEMKRFLFHELSDAERESLEERFFTDENFFYDLMELENSLVDAYARGELAGDDLKRFEASLEKSPERHEKIANAIALISLVKEEKQTAQNPVAITETQPTFWEKIASFFTLSAMQYASAALVMLLAVAAGFLLYERFQLREELAEYRENQRQLEELQKQEQNLQNQLREIQEREQALQKQIGEKQDESEILNQELESEKAERERLESELQRLRNLRRNLPPETQPENQPPPPTIATVVLLPFSGARDGSANNIKTIKISPNVKSVTTTLQLPKEATAETFSVRFGGNVLALNRKPRATKSGIRFLTVTIPANHLSTAEDNVIAVIGDEVRYNYVLKVQK